MMMMMVITTTAIAVIFTIIITIIILITTSLINYLAYETWQHLPWPPWSSSHDHLLQSLHSIQVQSIICIVQRCALTIHNTVSLQKLSTADETVQIAVPWHTDTDREPSDISDSDSINRNIQMILVFLPSSVKSLSRHYSRNACSKISCLLWSHRILFKTDIWCQSNVIHLSLHENVGKVYAWTLSYKTAWLFHLVKDQNLLFHHLNSLWLIKSGTYWGLRTRMLYLHYISCLYTTFFFSEYLLMWITRRKVQQKL